MMTRLEKHLKALPLKAHEPVDLQNRADILEAKLLFSSMSVSEVDDAEQELVKIRSFLVAA